MIFDFVNGKKVCSGIRRLKRHEVEFDNGKTERFDAIILATGYKSNVPSWLKVVNNNDNIVIYLCPPSLTNIKFCIKWVLENK